MVSSPLLTLIPVILVPMPLHLAFLVVFAVGGLLMTRNSVAGSLLIGSSLGYLFNVILRLGQQYWMLSASDPTDIPLTLLGVVQMVLSWFTYGMLIGAVWAGRRGSEEM